MSVRSFALAMASLLITSAATVHAQKATERWGAGPPSLPPGTRMAVISGDPTRPGPFTIRLELPDGFTVAPHFHPADEHQTLIVGRIGHGMGDVANEKSVKWIRPGQSVVIPANAHHYVMTRGRTVVAVSGVGPFRVTYVNPRDDPRARR